ncbi:hypothetical protein HYY75_05575 [bacterium]|nr:hypothetical protein [bacterium]
MKTLFSDQTQGLIEMIRDAENDPWRKNISPGIELISPELAKDPKISCSILEGTICKRFLYNVKFKVDLTKVRDILKTENREAAEEIDEKDLKSEFHCKHPDKSNPDTEKFNKALVQNRILWERDLPLLSQFVDFLPMEKDDKQIPPPLPKELTRDNFPAARLAIFSRGGDGRYPIKASDQGFYPYGYVTTRSRVFESIEQLEEFGIIEYPKPNMPGTRGKLNLRGNIAVIPTEEQLVELGKDGPLEINGQGVLMSYWGFNIKDELVKSGNGKNNLCVLRSINGPININTDKKIEAALIAINTTREGTPLLRISVSKSLNLKGALAADYLGAQYWPKSSHVIEYDSAFQSPEDLFQIYISRFVTFLRITETAS